MAILEVVRSVEIERDAEVVRRQFGDVAHHAAASLHRGVVLEVIAMRVVTPILRAQVGKQLAAALVEDKADLEGGAYGQA